MGKRQTGEIRQDPQKIRTETFVAHDGLGKDLTLEKARGDELFMVIESHLGFLNVKLNAREVLNLYQEFKGLTDLTELSHLYQEAKARTEKFKQSIGGQVVQQYVDPVLFSDIYVGDGGSPVAEAMVAEELSHDLRAEVLKALIFHYVEQANENLLKGLKGYIEEKFKAVVGLSDSIFIECLPYYFEHRNTTSVNKLNARKDEIDLDGRLAGINANPMLARELNVIEFLIQALENRGIGHRFDNAPKPGIRARRRGR